MGDQQNNRCEAVNLKTGQVLKRTRYSRVGWSYVKVAEVGRGLVRFVLEQEV